MTKTRIKLSGRNVNYLKAAAVKRAINGTVNRCMKILRRKLLPYKMYFDSYGKAIIPTTVIEETKKEMLDLKK